MYNDPYTIQTAMFGFEHVVLEARGAGVVASERGFAPRNNSEIRKEKNRQLSALATIHEYVEMESKEHKHGTVFCHNPYADFPLNPASWNNVYVSHMTLTPEVSDHFQDWKDVQCD